MQSWKEKGGLPNNISLGHERKLSGLVPNLVLVDLYHLPKFTMPCGTPCVRYLQGPFIDRRRQLYQDAHKDYRKAAWIVYI